MFFSTAVTVALLAIGATAAPTTSSAPSRPFKFAISDPKQGTLFLTASSAGTPNIERAVTCIVESERLQCGNSPSGPFNLGAPDFTGFDMSQFALTNGPGTTGWKIKADNSLEYKTWRGTAFFSLKDDGKKDIWIENCPTGGFFQGGHGHFVSRTVAKAVWV